MAMSSQWFYSLLSKAVIIMAGGLSLMIIGWPITEHREDHFEKLAKVNTQIHTSDHLRESFSEAPTYEGGTLGKRVNLNQGRLEDFERLPGIGTILAQRIVEHRESHGPFRTVNALRDVSGIGKGRIEGLRPLVSVSSEY